MLFEEDYSYQIISKDFFDMKYFSVKNAGGKVKRRIITFYDNDGEIIKENKTSNKVTLSKEADLSKCEIITKYYITESAGDYSDNYYDDIKYLDIINLGCIRRYKELKDADDIDDNNQVKAMLEKYDDNYNTYKKINDEDFLNINNKF